MEPEDTFPSSFMLTTIQPSLLASSAASRRRPLVYSQHSSFASGVVKRCGRVVADHEVNAFRFACVWSDRTA